MRKNINKDLKYVMLNLAEDYERLEPKIQSISNSKNKVYVDNFSKNGLDMWEFLNLLYKYSVTNRNCINFTVGTAISDGIYVNGEFSTAINDKFPFIELKKVMLDFKLYGNASCTVVYNTDGTIKRVYHIPNSQLRFSFENDKKIYLGDFKGTKVNPVNLIEIDTFSSDEITQTEDGELVKIFYLSTYDPTCTSYYSDPDYFSSVTFGECERVAAQQHLSMLYNDFSPSFIGKVNYSNLTEESKRDIESDFQKNFTGAVNARKAMLLIDNDIQGGINFEQFNPVDNHNTLRYLDEVSQQRILQSHRITDGMLLAINGATGFSNNAEQLETAFNLFQNTYIKEFRDEFLEIISPLLDEILGVEGSLFSFRNKPFISGQETEQVQVESSDNQEII